MGLVRGLKNINKRIEEEEQRFSNKDSVRWFKLEDKQAVTVQFLQELDEDSPNYSEKNGLGVLAIEHNNPAPGAWRNKALCTADEGPCWACDKHNENWKAGWKQKTRLYINVLVDDGVNEPYVAVMNQGNGPKSITPALIEIAGDLETITDTLFKVKRNGKGQTDTQYVLTQRGKTDNDVEQYELFDLEKVVRHVPYEEQEEFYNRNVADAVVEESEKVPAASSTEEDW